MMSLVLEIEYLTGLAFAARGPESGLPDWPPQPDRVFSALVAAWGARGEKAEEATALKWLEDQSAPRILASEMAWRKAAITYVPPNDAKAGRTGNLAVMPSFRPRQPRRFPAARPYDPVVRFYWEGARPELEILDALRRLASDTAYIGHSSSLTRCRFLLSEEAMPVDAKSAKRTVYKGRLAELCADYQRFLEHRGKVGRPSPGARVLPTAPAQEIGPQSCFSPDWLVLEHVGGQMPDVRAAALVSKEIRDALLSGYKQCGRGANIPATVSGHEPDGSPARDPHLAILPLAFAGFPHADGRVVGFGLAPPRNSGLLEDPEFLQALRRIAPRQEAEDRRMLAFDRTSDILQLRHFGLRLSPTFEPGKKSLNPARYARRSRIFASLTPIVLDRHLKENGAARQEEIAGQIRSGCKRIGLPEPEIVATDKHSAVEGAVSAAPSGNAPEWTRWRLPNSLASRQLTHATIRFSQPVEGPLILGAGRFIGLGLCLPLEDVESEA